MKSVKSVKFGLYYFHPYACPRASTPFLIEKEVSPWRVYFNAVGFSLTSLIALIWSGRNSNA